MLCHYPFLKILQTTEVEIIIKVADEQTKAQRNIFFPMSYNKFTEELGLKFRWSAAQFFCSSLFVRNSTCPFSLEKKILLAENLLKIMIA